MARTIRIDFDACPQDGWLVTRVLNFKEEVYRELRRGGHATAVDPSAVDQGLSSLVLTVASKRSLGSVSAAIASALSRHDVAGAVHVSRAS